jgi:hypothetical protein
MALLKHLFFDFANLRARPMLFLDSAECEKYILKFGFQKPP